MIYITYNAEIDWVEVEGPTSFSELGDLAAKHARAFNEGKYGKAKKHLNTLLDKCDSIGLDVHRDIKQSFRSEEQGMVGAMRVMRIRIYDPYTPQDTVDAP